MMRVLVSPGSALVGQRARLEEHESHHLRVRRAQDHELVEVLDGAGLLGTGELVRVGSEWAVEIRTAERRTRGPDLTVAVAAGDRERFSWMVEKAVELGVTAIIPIETERTSGVASRVRSSHVDRLRRVALEVTKQCGAAWVPVVEDPMPLGDFVSKDLVGAGWLADPAGLPPPAELGSAPLTLVIGPEGGLTEDERSALLAAGYQPTQLSANILRFETAALAAVSAATAARIRGQHG